MIAWRGPEGRLHKAVTVCLAANGLFAVFLLVRPLSHARMVDIADPALVVGLALAACLCLLPLGEHAGPAPPRGLLAGVPFLLGGAVMLGAITAALFGWYDLVLHHTIPPATIADVTFLAAHPLAFPALLLLPARRLAWLSRARAALDGLLLLAAALTFAWWFIVGPATLAAHQSPLVKLSQAAYPLSDLFVLACLLILVAQFSNATMRPTAVLLTAGLSALVTTDVLYDYQRLHAEYMASSFLDIGWLLSGTLVGLAALALRIALRSSDAGEQEEGTLQIESRGVQLLRSLVPQFLVVGVIVLTLVCWALYPHDHRATGLYLGAIAVVCLVLVRQLLAILESARLTGRLEHLATHDPLTGLVNRTLFLDRLAHGIASVRRRQTELAVLLIDLDRFKEINDTFGHHQGDRLLTQMAARLRGALRESDTVARLGGDEFAVVMPETDVRGAEIAAAKLLAALGQAVMIGNRSFESDASIGLAIYPAHGDDATALLQRADIAMYAAKRDRTGYAVFDPDHDDLRASRVNLAADLRRAIQQGELTLLYQPILDVVTGSLRSLEALARWHHPEHGAISPGEFIPLAEQTGLIGALTEWVLLAAHEQWRIWKSAGSAVPIAVNLSARCLFDERIASLIARLAVDPGWLEIEITESSLMADPEQAMDQLRRFHALGITIAIDDFGTGYSSLAYLKRLPADIIKIDRSFVLDMLEHQENSVIVHSVIDLAHNLGLLVTAEGVETAAAAMALQQMGGDLVQGFYFSRPIAASEAAAWLQSADLAAG